MTESCTRWHMAVMKLSAASVSIMVCRICSKYSSLLKSLLPVVMSSLMMYSYSFGRMRRTLERVYLEVVILQMAMSCLSVMVYHSAFRSPWWRMWLSLRSG